MGTVRGRAIAIFAPLIILGVLLGHAFANFVLGAPGGQAEMFDPGGPLVVPSVASIAALVGLIVVAWSLGRRGPERLSAIPFALLPPVFFVSIELVEAVVDRESLLTHGLLSPTFALGLVAQGPVAVICLAVARLLIRFGQAVQRVVGALGSSATLWAELRVWRASSELVVRAGTVFERRTRGPPSLA